MRSLPDWLIFYPGRSAPPESDRFGKGPQKPRMWLSERKRSEVWSTPISTGARCCPMPGIVRSASDGWTSA